MLDRGGQRRRPQRLLRFPAERSTASGSKDGPNAWLESVADLRPDLELADGAVLTTWPDGAYSAAGLDEHEDALAAPAGRSTSPASTPPAHGPG